MLFDRSYLFQQENPNKKTHRKSTKKSIKRYIYIHSEGGEISGKIVKEQ